MPRTPSSSGDGRPPPLPSGGKPNIAERAPVVGRPQAHGEELPRQRSEIQGCLQPPSSWLH
eukprot:3647040-Alexandrium_andersonii.AAC.1